MTEQGHIEFSSSTSQTGGRTKGGGVALEGRCCQTEARGLGSAAGVDAFSSAVLAWSSEGFIATVPVGTLVLARHENLPVAYSARGLQNTTAFREWSIIAVDAECSLQAVQFITLILDILREKTMLHISQHPHCGS